jgi:hypothetical protein
MVPGNLVAVWLGSVSDLVKNPTRVVFVGLLSGMDIELWVFDLVRPGLQFRL